MRVAYSRSPYEDSNYNDQEAVMARASTETLLYFTGRLIDDIYASSSRRKTTRKPTVHENSNRFSVLSSHLDHCRYPIHIIHLSISAFIDPSFAAVCCRHVVEYDNYVKRYMSMTSLVQTKLTLFIHSRLYLKLYFLCLFLSTIVSLSLIPIPTRP